jgi:hypothetical protein
MVVLDAVDVVDVSHKGLPAPFGKVAFLAPIFKQAGTYEAMLDIVPALTS